MKRPCKFNAGGWAPPGPYREQRVDQGQDFEIPFGHAIVAPGHGVCIEYAHDGPWPNGFGDPYVIVRIDSGRFKGHQWYLGHCNKPLVKPGEHFHAFRPLACTTHGFTNGWGWCELGEWTPGQGPSGRGQQFHHLFRPVWHWR